MNRWMLNTGDSDVGDRGHDDDGDSTGNGNEIDIHDVGGDDVDDPTENANENDQNNLILVFHHVMKLPVLFPPF